MTEHGIFLNNYISRNPLQNFKSFIIFPSSSLLAVLIKYFASIIKTHLSVLEWPCSHSCSLLRYVRPETIQTSNFKCFLIVWCCQTAFGDYLPFFHCSPESKICKLKWGDIFVCGLHKIERKDLALTLLRGKRTLQQWVLKANNPVFNSNLMWVTDLVKMLPVPCHVVSGISP